MLDNDVYISIADKMGVSYPIVRKNRSVFMKFIKSKLKTSKDLEFFNKTDDSLYYMEFLEVINSDDMVFTEHFKLTTYYPEQRPISYQALKNLQHIHSQLKLIRTLLGISDLYIDCKSKELIAANEAPIACINCQYVIVRLGDKAARDIFTQCLAYRDKLDVGLFTFSKQGLIIGAPFTSDYGMHIQNLFIDSINYESSTYLIIFDQ